MHPQEEQSCEIGSKYTTHISGRSMRAIDPSFDNKASPIRLGVRQNLGTRAIPQVSLWRTLTYLATPCHHWIDRTC